MSDHKNELSYRLLRLSESLNGLAALFKTRNENTSLSGDEMAEIGELLEVISQEVVHIKRELRLFTGLVTKKSKPMSPLSFPLCKPSSPLRAEPHSSLLLSGALMMSASRVLNSLKRLRPSLKTTECKPKFSLLQSGVLGTCGNPL